MLTHFSLRVVGKVQGVFFRASVQAKALELGLTGFVRNEPDGNVYLEAEGSVESLEKLVAWCRIGPPRATVEKVEVIEGTVRGFQGFEIWG